MPDPSAARSGGGAAPAAARCWRRARRADATLLDAQAAAQAATGDFDAGRRARRRGRRAGCAPRRHGRRARDLRATRRLPRATRLRRSASARSASAAARAGRRAAPLGELPLTRSHSARVAACGDAVTLCDLASAQPYARSRCHSPGTRAHAPARRTAMDLAFTPEQQTFREEVREWIPRAMPADMRRKAEAGASFHQDETMQWHASCTRRAGSRRTGPRRSAAPAGTSRSASSSARSSCARTRPSSRPSASRWSARC